MAERQVVLDQPEIVDEQAEALRHAVERAEHAEAELAKLKNPAAAEMKTEPSETGEVALRNDSMMAHLLDSLAEGKDIGHYGRLVFAMVARHFMSHEEVIAHLVKDRDFTQEQAVLMVRQVEGRDYNPPKRERILEWQREQEFPIMPYPNDPDCGNLYRNLKFPDAIYDHIEHYQEQKLEAED
jgi:hypothetical protein